MPNNSFDLMTILAKLIPFFIKLFALTIGGIISLIFSGDINLDVNDNAKLNINLKVVIKFICSITIGLIIGKFAIDYFNFEHFNYYGQAAIMMMFSIFGMLVFGILYRSVQLTLSDKTLSQTVEEIKETAKALLK